MVQIIPGGGRFGFTPSGDVVLTQDTPVCEVAETADRFGLAITTGIFGRSRNQGGLFRQQASLQAACRSRTWRPAGTPGWSRCCGARLDKPRRANNIGITQNSAGVADQAEPGDQFGRAAATLSTADAPR